MTEPAPATKASVLVVLPAFNEQEALPMLLRELADTLPDAEVLVVDDGSRDATVAVARAHGARVLELPFNVGVGGALRAGLLVAHREGYGVAVQCDADGQHPPAAIMSLVDSLADADIVIGARFAGEGSFHAAGARWLAMRVLARSMSRIMAEPLTDVTSGFRAFGPRAIEVLSAQLPPEYLGDTIEALAIARQHGMRVVQVPVAMRVRQGGVASHRAFRSAIYLARAVFMLVLSVLRLAGRREETT